MRSPLPWPTVAPCEKVCQADLWTTKPYSHRRMRVKSPRMIWAESSSRFPIPQVGSSRYKRSDATGGRDHQSQLPHSNGGDGRTRSAFRARTRTLLRDRPPLRGGREQAGPPGWAPATPRAAALDEPAAIVTEFITGAWNGLGRPPRALDAAADRSIPVRASTTAPRPPDPCNVFDSFRIVETYAADRARSRRRRSPRPLRRPTRRRGGRAGSQRARARPGPLPQRPARRQLHPRRERTHLDRRLGVRGDGATATSTSRTSR